MVVIRGVGLIVLLGCSDKVLDRNNRGGKVYFSSWFYEFQSITEGKARLAVEGHCGVYVIWSVEEANIIANGEAEWPGLGTVKDLSLVTHFLYLGPTS